MDSPSPADVEACAEAAGFTAARSIVVASLDPPADARVAFDPDRPLYPASMIKTPLVAAMLVEVHAGRLRLSDRYPVADANMTYNDAPSPLHPGYRAMLEEIGALAISNSDNVATNMLFDIVGRERATSIARDVLGLDATAFYRKLSGSDPLIDDPGWDGVHRNAHPAGDAATLFSAIARDDVPNADLLRSFLRRQYWNDKLSRGLRAGDEFAHKTGDTDDVTHDGGILTTVEGRSYVVVVYTGAPSTDANNARFGEFMRRLRPLL